LSHLGQYIYGNILIERITNLNPLMHICMIRFFHICLSLFFSTSQSLNLVWHMIFPHQPLTSGSSHPHA